MDRFFSGLVGHNLTIELFDIVKIPGAFFFKMTKKTFNKNAVSFLLLYRKNSLNREQSLYLIQHFLGNEIVDVLLVDFNVNVFSDGNYFLDFLTELKQVVTPTHISGSLIDHIYVHKNVLNTFEVDTPVCILQYKCIFQRS